MPIAGGTGQEPAIKVGVISDTHGLLRPEALEALRGADHILHAGDIGAPGLIDVLGRLAPTTAIRGNVDRGDWAADFPEALTLRLGGLSIHLVHDLGTLDFEGMTMRPDVLIFGHSHQPLIDARGDTLFLNPGSAGPRRFRLPITLASLVIADGKAAAFLHEILS